MRKIMIFILLSCFVFTFSVYSQSSESFNNTISSFEKAMTQTGGRISEVLEINYQLKEENQELIKENEDLKNYLNKYKSDLDKLQRKVPPKQSVKMDSLRKYPNQINDLKKSLSAKQREISSINQEFKQFKQDSRAFKEKTEEELYRIAQENINLKQAKQQAIEELNKFKPSSVRESQGKGEIAQLKQEINRLKDKNQSFKGDIRVSELEMDKIKKSFLVKEKEFFTSLKQNRNEFKNLKDELEEALKQSDNLKRDVVFLTQQNNNLKEDKSNIEKKLGNIKIDLSVRERKSLSRVNQEEKEIARFQMENKQLTYKISSLERDRERLNKKITQLKKDSGKEKSKEKTRLEGLKTATRKSKVDILLLSNFKEENEELNLDNEKLSLEAEKLQERIAALEENSSSLEKDIAFIKEQKSKLSEELRDKQKILDELDNLKKGKKQLAQELENKELYLERLTEKQKIREENLTKTWWGKMEELMDEVTSLREENKLLESSVNDLGVENIQTHASLYIELGLAYAKAKLYDEAISAFEKSLDFDSLNPDAYYNLGLLYQHHRGNDRKALIQLKKYLELNPNAQDKTEVKELIAMIED